MAIRETEYKGKLVSVESQQRVGGGWHWTYQIDGGPIRMGEDRPLQAEELALQEGLQRAKFEIDGR